MRLGFYINSITRLRDQENSGELEPALVASMAMAAGAQVILAGWTNAGGSLTERDLRLIRELIHGDLVLVVPLGEKQMESAVKFHPEGVILVASGWDTVRDFRPVQMEVDSKDIAAVASAYRAAGVQPLVLVDPEPGALKIAARCGLAGVVLDTSQYGSARIDEEAQDALDRLTDCAMAANRFGLVAAAGHGLNYQNVGPIAGLRYVEEIFIGRSIVVRALNCGIDKAVADMLKTIDRYRV